MELKDFITETIVQITQGVVEAQKQTEQTGAIIIPGKMFGSEGVKFIRADNDGHRFIQDLELNVVVTVSEKEGSKAGIGVLAGIISSGTSISADEASTKQSTIKIVLPIALPIGGKKKNSA